MTSSHHVQTPKGKDVHGMSSRDRSFSQRPEQPRRAIHQNAAACVSLSNSTMSKTVAGSANPTRLTPGGRRRRLSRGPPLPRQPDFSVFFRNLRNTRKPRKSVNTNISTPAKLEEIQRTSSVLPGGDPSGRRLSRGPPLPRQPDFSVFFRRLRPKSNSTKNHRRT